MKNEIKKPIHIIGITVRTTNENGQASGDIGELWNNFFEEDILHKIPNKVNDDIYVVYNDYELDYTKPYTTLLGAAVTSLDEIPSGMNGISLNAMNYQKFISQGKMPEAILNTWLDIWADQALNNRRAYISDFTIHGPDYFKGDHATVETFISVI